MPPRRSCGAESYSASAARAPIPKGLMDPRLARPGGAEPQTGYADGYGSYGSATRVDAHPSHHARPSARNDRCPATALPLGSGQPSLRLDPVGELPRSSRVIGPGNRCRNGGAFPERHTACNRLRAPWARGDRGRWIELHRVALLDAKRSQSSRTDSVLNLGRDQAHLSVSMTCR